MNKRPASEKTVWLRWLLATSLGWAAGVAVTWSVAPWFSWDYTYAFGFTFMCVCLFFVGLFVGSGQWMLLRAKFDGASAWIPATAITLPVGFYVGYYRFVWIVWQLAKLDEVPDYAHYIASGCAAGLLLGILQWLSLRRGFGDMWKWIVGSALSWGTGIAIAWFVLDIYARQGYNGDRALVAACLAIGMVVAAINGAFASRCILNLPISKSALAQQVRS